MSPSHMEGVDTSKVPDAGPLSARPAAATASVSKCRAYWTSMAAAAPHADPGPHLRWHLGPTPHLRAAAPPVSCTSPAVGQRDPTNAPRVSQHSSERLTHRLL